MRAYDPDRPDRDSERRSVCLRKLDTLGWAVEGTFELGSAQVGIRTTSARVGAWIDDVLADHRLEAWTDATYSLVIAEDAPGRRGFHILYRGIAPLVRTTDLATVARAFLMEMELHALSERRDAIFLNAAVLGGPRGAALIPSSLTTLLGSRHRLAERWGLALPGAGWAAVDPETGDLVPVASGIGVPADAVEQLVGRPETSVPARCFVDDATPVEAVLFLERERPAAPVSRAAGLYRLASNCLNLPLVGGSGGMEGLGHVAGRADLRAVALGPLPGLVEEIGEAMAEPGRVRALT
jgi:hypothetical protein